MIPQNSTLSSRKRREYSSKQIAAALVLAKTRLANRQSKWLEDRGVYVNRETGREYRPHHKDEEVFVYSDTPRYALAKGGEGGGKSVAGIIKGLERLRRSMSGIMVSPDLPHFRRSLWPEFKRWCPWEEVIESQQYRGSFSWEPSQSFTLFFKNGASLMCGGIESPGSWEGPNVSWWLFDEARKHREASALKVLDGRARIPGPNGEPPQGFITTTPRMHWLWEYFGPLEKEDDPFRSFKENSLVITLLTADNAHNLSKGFVKDRSQSLTEAEIRVLLNAEWESIEDTTAFLDNALLWDAIIEDFPPLGDLDTLVLGADAGVSSDCFGLVGVTVHPTNEELTAVRYSKAWVPPTGGTIDFDEVEKEIRWLCENFHVLQLAYDPYQLHQMGTRLLNEGVVWSSPFSQGGERLEADRLLLDSIRQARIRHPGDPDLTSHILNADRKVDADHRKIRIVKRTSHQKVDLAVALSMANKRLQDLT